MKIFQETERNRQVATEKPLILTDADFQFNEVRVPWETVSECRFRPKGGGDLEIVTTNGRSVRVPRTVKIYYGAFPLTVGPDPYPYLEQRIREKCPRARMVSVSDKELILLLIVLNAEILGVILALFLHKNIGAAMLIAAAAGVPAAFAFGRADALRSLRLPWRK